MAMAFYRGLEACRVRASPSLEVTTPDSEDATYQRVAGPELCGVFAAA